MSNTNDMTVGNPTRAIIKFALPLVMGYLLQQMYSIIDAAIVGQFVGVEGLAAIGASSSILFLVLGFCNGACAGFAVPVSQAFGAKEYSKMRSFVANSIRIAVVLALTLTVVTCGFCTNILKMVNTPVEIHNDAWVYLFIQFLSIPLIIAYNLLSGFIRALGNSKQPFYFLLIASVANIVLDLLLILVFDMGVAGASLATLISVLLTAILCLIYIRRKMDLLIPRDKEKLYSEKRIGTLLNNGIPMGLQFSITAIGSIMIQGSNNALGTIYVAAFTASQRIKFLFTTVFENVGVAMATYCGQNIGARKIDRIPLGIRSATKISMAFFVFSALVIFPLSDQMMRIFVDAGETEIISAASMQLKWGTWFFPSLAMLTILRYSIQGLGYSNLSMMSGVMEMVARCFISFWVVPAIGFLGVCIADPAAWVCADIFLFPAIFFLVRHLHKKFAVNY